MLQVRQEGSHSQPSIGSVWGALKHVGTGPLAAQLAAGFPSGLGVASRKNERIWAPGLAAIIPALEGSHAAP